MSGGDRRKELGSGEVAARPRQKRGPKASENYGGEPRVVGRLENEAHERLGCGGHGG
jgi:hypothetical protein